MTAILKIFALYDRLSYNLMMKVTALIPDELVNEVKYLTQGKNITESLTIALNEWVENQKSKKQDLAEFVGVWKDKNINKKDLRKKAWK